MRIGVIGTAERIAELANRLGSKHEIVEVKDNNFDGLDILFDLAFDLNTSGIDAYVQLKFPVVLNAVTVQLEAALAKAGVKNNGLLYGINALPGFLALDKWECCTTTINNRQVLEKMGSELGVDIAWVESRVGLVTPRILFMIINEAYYTVQEGTASKEHINTGMKLGTNYPGGPFEWVNKIGIDNVYNALHALYEDTGDERYKICPLLKTEKLRTTI